MEYNFDEQVDRENTACSKYDLRSEVFGKKDVIPMWVADLDFKTPSFILDAIRKRLDHEILGYSFRTDSFYESIVNWLKRRQGWNVRKEWIAFSPGIVPALNMAVMAFTEPGDKIIIQKPVYFPFFPAVESHNRVLVNNPLRYERGRYEMDFEDLLQKIDSRVKMIMLCSPHNPTGNVWKHKDLERLTDICLKNRILILSDEIHSDLIYKGSKHIPTASLSPEVSDITFTCIAPSKTFNLAGLSTSAVITSNKTLKEKYDRILEDIHLGGGNLFGFIALEAAYNKGEKWLDALMDYLQDNLNYLVRYLNENIPLIKPVIPEATYMVWLDCHELGLDDKELKKFMIHEAGLGLSEGIIFGIEGSGFQRMNIGCPKAMLANALHRLKNAVVQRFAE
ncbi:MAG TPA: PatB family C-S lyase [Bacteroidales bacterium]|nr:PatB family C-S lyase [Bacteroidales bacterium]